MPGSADGPMPIACTLTPDELGQRRGDLLPGLIARATTVEPQADGYLLQFHASAELLHSVADVIEAERHCCGFLRFELIVDGGDSVSLKVSGPEGTRAFLDGLLR